MLVVLVSGGFVCVLLFVTMSPCRPVTMSSCYLSLHPHLSSFSLSRAFTLSHFLPLACHSLSRPQPTVCFLPLPISISPPSPPRPPLCPKLQLWYCPQGTLQQFIDDLFMTILRADCTLPPAVKHLFDFLDSAIKRHNIVDPEVIHTWKSNRSVAVGNINVKWHLCEVHHSCIP